MKKAIQIHQDDNVATVPIEVQASEEVEILSPQGEVLLKTAPGEKIPNGHKLALSALDQGARIVKYGQVIGVASRPIAQGDWVHTHNVESDRMAAPGKEG